MAVNRGSKKVAGSKKKEASAPAKVPGAAKEENAEVFGGFE